MFVTEGIAFKCILEKGKPDLIIARTEAAEENTIRNIRCLVGLHQGPLINDAMSMDSLSNISAIAVPDKLTITELEPLTSHT